MSRVLIDTSSIINFVKLSYSIDQFSNPNAIIKRHPLDVILVDLIENIIEAFIFYDEILLDERSISQSLNNDTWVQMFERPYSKLISTSACNEKRIYTEIISKFELNNTNLSSIVHSIPNDWAPFFDSHANLSIKGFIQNEEVIGSYYTQNLHSCIEFIKKKQVEKYISEIPKQIIYEIVRYLYYVYLQRQENAQLIIHPCRANIPIMLDVYNNPFKTFLSNANKIWGNRVHDIYNNHSDILPIPFIASYILNKTKSVENLFDVIEEVRNSKEAVKFRKAFNNLIQYVEKNDVSNLEKIQNEFRETLLNWEDNLNIVPGYRSKTINIMLPIVSFDIDIPYIGGNRTARNLMTFLHKTLLKQDDYHIYKQSFYNCHRYRRLHQR